MLAHLPCFRQVFREMNCRAAVCVDAANASLSGFERDIRDERAKAAVAVKGDILSLLKHSSLYLLATSYRGALAKLVYLYRAMHSSAGEGIITFCHLLLMAFNVVTTVCVQFWMPCYVPAMKQADVLFKLLKESGHMSCRHCSHTWQQCGARASKHHHTQCC